MIFLTVSGKPIPQARPRLTKRGGVYNPQYKELAETKRTIANQLSYMDDFQTQEGAIQVGILFHMPIPKTSKHEALEYHLSKGDIDNLAKFYLDAMNGLVYRDDAIVCKLFCAKVYSTQPRTEIIIKKLGKKYGSE